MLQDALMRAKVSQIATSSMVFVVDDDATICTALERLLRSAGHEVETFPSAEAFLARQPEAFAGTLILDVCMPKTSGLELQAWLVERGWPLRIFFMSALDDAHVRSSAMRAGARAWFTKPLDCEALLAALAERSCPKVQ
jgi:FixJ family two-component response regulator